MKTLKRFESFTGKINEGLKTAHVKFQDPSYNYSTSVNGALSDQQVKDYFIGKTFNLGQVDQDDLQVCIDCVVDEFKDNVMEKKS